MLNENDPKVVVDADRRKLLVIGPSRFAGAGPDIIDDWTKPLQR